MTNSYFDFELKDMKALIEWLENHQNTFDELNAVRMQNKTSWHVWGIMNHD